MSQKHLSDADIERFEAMANNGSTANELFARAMSEGYNKYDGIVLLRKIFDFNLIQCTEVVQNFDKQGK